MSLLKSRLFAVGLREIAAELWEYFAIAERKRAGTATRPQVLREEEIARLRADLRPLVSILRSFLKQEPPEPAAIEAFASALNQPVRVTANFTEPERSLSKRELKKGSHKPFLYISVGTPSGKVSPRYPAELLVRLIEYFEYFRDQPHMLARSPIAVCASCGGLFHRKRVRKADQTCSARCRFEKWRMEKQAKDPDYFTRKARKNREAKRRKTGKGIKRKKRQAEITSPPDQAPASA